MPTAPDDEAPTGPDGPATPEPSGEAGGTEQPATARSAESTQPAESAEPAEPTRSAEPAESAEPTRSAEPAQPAESAEPAESAGSREPSAGERLEAEGGEEPAGSPGRRGTWRPSAWAQRLRALAFLRWLHRLHGPAWPRRLYGRRSVRIALVVLVGLAGGLIGMLLGGRVETPVGPADVALSVRPSWNGGTTIDIPPLGTLQMDSHWGPIRLEAQVAEIHPESARRLIENGTELDDFTESIGDEVRSGLLSLAARALAFALAFGLMAGLLVFRSGWRALQTTFVAALGFVLVAGVAGLTFNPQSVAEPRYTGLLANAPQLVGDARSIVRRFDEYRAQLARLVGNVSRLYAATSTLPTYEPDPTTVRVLHVSDIHLNPVAWSIIRSVSQQFQVNVIVDSGDLTDHGSKAEDKFISEIESLKIPYVFVRGNHDSKATQRAVAKQKNAIVLDGQAKEVAGLRIYGIGDPRFTPDKTTRDDDVGAAQLQVEGRRIADQVRAAGLAPDLAVIHDPNEGQEFNGATPLVLSGHSHSRVTRLMSSGTRLFVQGSTGGAGLRGLDNEQPTPFEMSILYFNRTSRRLQGWDDFRLGGLGLTSAQIERHLEPQPDRTIGPPPTATPTPPGSGSPSGSPLGSPAGSPSGSPASQAATGSPAVSPERQ